MNRKDIKIGMKVYFVEGGVSHHGIVRKVLKNGARCVLVKPEGPGMYELKPEELCRRRTYVQRWCFKCDKIVKVVKGTIFCECGKDTVSLRNMDPEWMAGNREKHSNDILEELWNGPRKRTLNNVLDDMQVKETRNLSCPVCNENYSITKYQYSVWTNPSNRGGESIVCKSCEYKQSTIKVGGKLSL
jgi:hypothetical protein